MKETGVEIQIVDRRTMQCLPEICHEGTTYIVAEPRKEYMIRARVEQRHLRDSGSIKIQPYIDGKKLNWDQLVDHENWELFEGFSLDPDFRRFRAFTFDFPPAQGASMTADLADAGSISVEFITVYATGRPAVRHENSAIFNHSQLAVPEGKKMTKSLTTRAGSQIETALANPVPVEIVYDHGQVFAKLTVRYQANTWLLRAGILAADNPVHAAMLPIAAITAPVKVKTEEEREAARAERRRPRPDTVDECDLTGDDVTWQAKKVQLPSVEIPETD
eukprot:TRINITY_DN4613_c0_g1_i3.p2 TRINITY_DN4613_c0_g1~~TRINITY_DN4613_c0_g1_i3.p2  ORF type:complete len:276 (-),score=46.56 TRINITY_DN4613_c0_g1_i3:1675-2502(-)